MSFLDEISDSIVNTTKDLSKMAQNAGDLTKLQYDKNLKKANFPSFTRSWERSITKNIRTRMMNALKKSQPQFLE